MKERNYQVISENGQNYIFEVPTGTKIFAYHKEKDAIHICKRLNSGGGFNGFTPKFFTNPLP